MAQKMKTPASGLAEAREVGSKNERFFALKNQAITQYGQKETPGSVRGKEGAFSRTVDCAAASRDIYSAAQPLRSMTFTYIVHRNLMVEVMGG